MNDLQGIEEMSNEFLTMAGDHIGISNNGSGMPAYALLQNTAEKGLSNVEAANGLDERQSLQPAFLPGSPTKGQISGVSGLDVGMDVIKNSIEEHNGRIDIDSTSGNASTFILAVDGYVGRVDVVIKLMGDVMPRDIASATLPGNDSVVLVVDMKRLFDATPGIHDERALTAAAA